MVLFNLEKLDSLLEKLKKYYYIEFNISLFTSLLIFYLTKIAILKFIFMFYGTFLDKNNILAKQ